MNRIKSELATWIDGVHIIAISSLWVLCVRWFVARASEREKQRGAYVALCNRIAVFGRTRYGEFLSCVRRNYVKKSAQIVCLWYDNAKQSWKCTRDRDKTNKIAFNSARCACAQDFSFLNQPKLIARFSINVEIREWMNLCDLSAVAFLALAYARTRSSVSFHLSKSRFCRLFSYLSCTYHFCLTSLARLAICIFARARIEHLLTRYSLLRFPSTTFRLFLVANQSFFHSVLGPLIGSCLSALLYFDATAKPEWSHVNVPKIVCCIKTKFTVDRTIERNACEAMTLIKLN